jgi:hypothetical protein
MLEMLKPPGKNSWTSFEKCARLEVRAAVGAGIEAILGSSS